MAFPAGCYPRSQKPLSAPFVGVLEAFSPDHAWSHRRALVTAPGSLTLMQVRRTSDDTPQDVTYGPDGEAGIAGLLSFIGSSSGAVATLKDQVGSADFIQPTADYQRIIVDAGTLVTVGGKAASRGLSPPDLSSVGGGMYTDTISTYTGTAASVFFRGKHDTYSGFFNAIVDAYFGFAKNADSFNASRPVSTHRNGTGALGLAWLGDFSGAFTSDYLISLIWDGTNVTMRDGTNTYTLAASSAFDFNRFMFGCLNDITTQIYCADANNWQEAAVWYSDQTANEAAIRSALMA